MSAIGISLGIFSVTLLVFIVIINQFETNARLSEILEELRKL